jgi:hypothetical protein
MALVHVCDNLGCKHVVHALIDSASQVSTITTSCINRLGLKQLTIKQWTVSLTGLSGVLVPSVSGVVNCIVNFRYNDNESFSIKA